MATLEQNQNSCFPFLFLSLPPPANQLPLNISHLAIKQLYQISACAKIYPCFRHLNRLHDLLFVWNAAGYLDRVNEMWRVEKPNKV